MTQLPHVRPSTDEEIDDAAEAWATLLDEVLLPAPEPMAEGGGMLLLEEKYNPHQARDRTGKWTSGGGGDLIAQAKAAEPGITADLQALAGQHGGEMVGLENRLKEGPSLERKIANYQEQGGLTRAQAEASVNDAVRYTMVFDEHGYSAGVGEVAGRMQAAGYTLHRKPRNYFATPDETGYLGINSVWVSPSGQRFELQFHTPASFKLKSESHVWYDEHRRARTREGRAAVEHKMRSAWGLVSHPPGAAALLL